MANALTKLGTVTLTSTKTSVEFSSIPGTYKHLMFALHQTSSSNGRELQAIINGSTSTIYSHTRLIASGATGSSAITSDRGSGMAYARLGDSQTERAITNLWFPNYTSTTHNKLFLFDGVDGYQSRIFKYTNSWDSKTAITSVKFNIEAAQVFQIGDTFSLYGIG